MEGNSEERNQRDIRQSRDRWLEKMVLSGIRLMKLMVGEVVVVVDTEVENKRKKRKT